ncbi:MAG: hypothetical protein ACR2N7_02005 [Acidimicrobiia bacterium]
MESIASKLSDRTGGMAGIAFVTLVFASWVTAASGEFEGIDQSAEAIARDLANRSLEASITLAGLAAIAGFWFVGSLHLRLTARGPSTAAWAAFGGGLAMVTLFLAGSAITSAAVSVASLNSDPQVAKTLWLLEHGFSNVIGPALIVFILGVSISSINRGDPSRWLGYSGVVASVVLVMNTLVGSFNLAVLVLLWVLALAINMTISPQSRPE